MLEAKTLSKKLVRKAGNVLSGVSDDMPLDNAMD